MIYLNLETKILSSEEFGSVLPNQIATWICLMLWCAIAENKGRIKNAKSFTDRQWLLQAKVEAESLKESCSLYHWDGEDLVVAFYPVSQQKAMDAKRKAGNMTAAKFKDSLAGCLAGSLAGREGKVMKGKVSKIKKEWKEMLRPSSMEPVSQEVIEAFKWICEGTAINVPSQLQAAGAFVSNKPGTTWCVGFFVKWMANVIMGKDPTRI